MTSEEEIKVDDSWQDTQRFHGLDFNLITRRALSGSDTMLSLFQIELLPQNFGKKDL